MPPQFEDGIGEYFWLGYSIENQFSGKNHILSDQYFRGVISYIIINSLERNRMLPNTFNFFSPYTIQVSPQNDLNPSFFPFTYPCYLPLALYPQNQTYQIIQIQSENIQRQFQPKIPSKMTDSERSDSKTEMKKKPAKQNKRELQPSIAKRAQLKGGIDLGEQKQGRNANSNLLRMFFRRLQFKIENEEQKLLKLWNKFNLTISVSDFKTWVREARIDYRNYIRVPSVKKLFKTSSKVREHSKILRVMLKTFLDDESICCYLTSRKIKKESMPHNLLSIRSIIAEIFSEEDNC